MYQYTREMQRLCPNLYPFLPLPGEISSTTYPLQNPNAKKIENLFQKWLEPIYSLPSQVPNDPRIFLKNCELCNDPTNYTTPTGKKIGSRPGPQQTNLCMKCYVCFRRKVDELGLTKASQLHL